MNKITQAFKNLKLTRKIQLGFLMIAVISTLLAINDFFQFQQLGKVGQNIFDNYITPSETTSKIITDIDEIQKWMLKFSNPKFGEKFQEGLNIVNSKKKSINQKLEQLITDYANTDLETSLKLIQTNWINYNSLVVDGIISGASMQLYDMAADIATTMGETESKNLNNEIASFQEQMKIKAIELKSKVESQVDNSVIFLIVGMLLGTITFLLAAFVFGPSITRPILRLKEIIGEYSFGKFDSKILINQKDEVGELANMLRTLRSTQQEKIDAAKEIAKGNFIKVKPASEHDQLSFAFNSEVETIENIVNQINIISNKNEKEGDLKARLPEEEFVGGWKQIANSIDNMLDKIIEPINEASHVLAKMADGDFTVKMVGNYKGDYLAIKNDVNKVSDSMNEALGRFFESVNYVSRGVMEIGESSALLAQGANDQNLQSAEVAGAVEEMTKTIMENSRSINLIEQKTRDAETKAKEGGIAVENTVKGIDQVAEIVLSTSSTMQELGISSQKITEVLKVIYEIADQTNLLALNAAIEAARAGEQGRGFAVVADEVRKLAERTQNATKEIGLMITEIQTRTKSAIEGINESHEVVQKDKDLAHQAGAVLNEIIENSNQISDLIAQLATAIEQQSSTSEEISRNITTIAGVAEESAHNTTLISSSSDELYNSTNELHELIAQFKIENHTEKLLN